MDDVQKRIEENLAKGLILDSNGQWISMEKQLAAEREVRFHLQNGEVLKDGKWISIEQALSAGNQ